MLVIVIVIMVESLKRTFIPSMTIMSVTIIVIVAIGLLVNLSVAFLLTRGHRTLNIHAVLLRVIGDLLGALATLASGIVTYHTHWTGVDPLLSLFIALLIGFSSIRMLKEALHILMEGVPHHLDIKTIQRSIARVDGVLNVHDPHIWSLSSYHVPRCPFCPHSNKNTPLMG